MPQFQEYRQQVIDAYKAQKQLGQLSINLKRPTPAHLRAECLSILSKRFSNSDENLLRDFFGDSIDLAATIRHFDIDKFKPLVNFLEGKTKTTEDKNVELLAWLIDFKERPFQFDYQGRKPMEAPSISSEEHQNTPLTIHEFTPKIKKETVGNQEVKRIQSPIYQRKYLWIMMLSLSSLGFAGYFYWTKSHEQNKDCMYWSGNHFVSIDCNQQLPHVQVIALDTFKLHQQFKVLHPDSLDQAALHKLWYSKINKQIEFFNIGGPHPEHPERQLKPISDYIIKKYITPVVKK